MVFMKIIYISILNYAQNVIQINLLHRVKLLGVIFRDPHIYIQFKRLWRI